MTRKRAFTWFSLSLALVLPVSAQTITTVGGTSTWGRIYDVAVDAMGNQYIPDGDHHVVYRVDRLGATSVVAGTGSSGFSGDGGLATNAQLRQPSGVAVDGVGNLYIADTSNNRLRKVSGGIITTIAGDGVSRFTGDGDLPPRPASARQSTSL